MLASTHYSTLSSSTSFSFSHCPCIRAKLDLSRKEEMNCLSISFFPSPLEEIEAMDTVKFYLQQATSDTAISQELLIRECSRVVDVYPLNGVTKNRNFKITDFMQPSHRREIGQMIERLHEIDPKKNSVRCLVIDFKDISGRYDNLVEISATETNFSAFFQGDVPKTDVQRIIQKLIRDNEINFFI
ncbi:MAG: hypothetical protein ACHQUC_10685, partial [Chlamydiales bacterium]